MHEQSETIQAPNGDWLNVFGRMLAQRGQQLPGTIPYRSKEDAVRAADFRSKTEGMSPAMPMLPQGGPVAPSPTWQQNLRSQLGVDEPNPYGDLLNQVARWYADSRFGQQMTGSPWEWFQRLSGAQTAGREAAMPGNPKRFGKFGPLEEGYDFLLTQAHTPGANPISSAKNPAMLRPGGVLKPDPYSDEIRGAHIPQDVMEQTGEVMEKSKVGTRVRGTATGSGPVKDVVKQVDDWQHTNPDIGLEIQPRQFRGSAPNDPDAIALLAKMLDSLGLRKVAQHDYWDRLPDQYGKLGQSAGRWDYWNRRGDFTQP